MKSEELSKPVLKEFFRYVPFSVFAMIANSCYILADTFFVSKGMGVNGLSALNIALPVFSIIHGSGLMLGMGGATKFSVYRSRGEHDKADAVFTNIVYPGVLFSVIFMLLGAFLSEEISVLLGADESTLGLTNIYLKVLMLFSPAFIFNNILACFVRNDGAPKLAMFTTVSGSLMNILLDWVFIFPCNMGMFGAILATGLAPVIGICVSCIHIIRRKNNFRLQKQKPDVREIGSGFALGLPSFVEQLSSAVVVLVFNYIMLGINGNTGVAAYGIVANISLVVASVFTGISQGVQPLISHAHGEGENGKGKAYFICALTASAIFAVIVYIVIFFFAEPIADIFNSENQPRLTSMAAEGMRIYFTAILFLGFNVILCVYFTSTAKALPAQIISLLRGLVVIIPSALILSLCFGVTGVWLSYPITECLVAVIGVAVLFALLTRQKRTDKELESK